MTDRRFLAANARVGWSGIERETEAPRRVDGTLMRVAVPVADLRAAPDGPRDKQLRFGQTFRALESHAGWTFGFDGVDGYVGYLTDASLAPNHDVTHRIGARATHVYSAPDIKSPERCSLPFFAEVRVASRGEALSELSTGGFVPTRHLVALDWRADDIVAVARACLGTPYLWGGDSTFGIDCSGLVQVACHATGRGSPRDSDLQASGLGVALDPDTPPEPGDLWFWDGHVGILSTPNTLLHANGHHMAVVEEPLAEAVERIQRKEGLAVTVRRRL